MGGRRAIDAALIYAERGWPVFPTHNPVSRRGAPMVCSCGHGDCSSVGKHPRTRDGFKSATTEADQIRSWWSTWPHAGVGIQTGAPSGLVVVDVDPAHGGNDTLKAIEEKHGAFPLGRTVRTGSGGTHLYFLHPGHDMANSAGRLGPGIDTRADGGYVLAPPSRHRTGGVYVVAGHGMQIPELPIWLLQTLEPPPPRPMPEGSAPKDVGAWAKAAVTGELDRLGHAKEGSRNDTLNRVAYRLGQIIGSGALAEHEIEPMLIERGIALGLREREVVKTVQSGMQAGEGSPRGPNAHRTPEPEF